MNRALQFVTSLCILATSAQAQQIASVDLSHLKAPAESAQQEGEKELPKGCEKLLPGDIFDGVVMPPKHEPREIDVEMVELSNENPVVGSEVQGEVQLRNSGKYPIKIPWSTDPNIIEKGQNPNRLQWEEGGFSIELKHGYELLGSLSQSLFGSRFSAGSELAIQPGEWVTAVVRFKLAPQYGIPGQSVRKGKRDLFVEWKQGGKSKVVRNCSVSTEWFDYRNYYRQQNPTVTINVN